MIEREQIDAAMQASAAASSQGGDAAEPGVPAPVRAPDDPLTQRLQAAAAAPLARQPKRKASGEHPEDPRFDNGEGAEVVMEPAQASGTKRRAETDAHDSARGDLGSVEAGSFHCEHCSQRYNSRNLLFRHLYDRHDADSCGARQRTLQTDVSSAGSKLVKPLMAIEDFRGHPSPVLKPSEINDDELKWRDIGSGIFAKTFKGATHIADNH